MKLTKSQIQEIVDATGELIGADDYPENGVDLETAANNTTDYNSTIGHQPYRYDMLGRFGFTLLPFFEGEEKGGKDDLLDAFEKLMHDRYEDILGHYYRHPNQLQPHYRKLSKGENPPESVKYDKEWAEKALDLVKKHFEGALKELNENLKEGLNEGSFREGKMLEKKDDKGVVGKKEDKDVVSKKAKKIADLINKLDKEDIKKIKNLLETE